MSDFNGLCEELILHLGGVLPPKSPSRRYKFALLWALRSRIPYLEVKMFDLEGQFRLTIMGKPITCFGDFLILDMSQLSTHSYEYLHSESTENNMHTTNTRKITAEITRNLLKLSPEFVSVCEGVIETLGGCLPTAEELFHHPLNLSELSNAYKTLLLSKIEHLEPAFKVTADIDAQNLFINDRLIEDEDDLLDVIYNLGE